MYFVIGASLLFAYLYGVNLAATLISTAMWRLLPNWTMPRKSRRLANMLFLFRVLPVAAALVFVLAFIIPSFLMFEPENSGETFGLKMAVAVGISAFGIIAAAIRIVLSRRRTHNLVREWMLDAEPVEIDGVDLPAFKIRHPFPVIAVVGVFRARLFVAEQVFEMLTKEEMSAAMVHEAGHITAKDNLKRVLMRSCADLLILPLGKRLDRLWSEAVERAADEFAADQNGRTALDLASALIKIGRTSPIKGSKPLPIAAYLVDPTDASLASRIERLISLADARTEGRDTVMGSRAAWIVSVLIGSLVVMLAVNEAVLFEIHAVSERLIAVLQ